MSSPEMVSIVHRAIDRERDAINAYLGLAKIVTDVKAKNVLIHLASDEVGHMTKLEKHLISVLRGKDWATRMIVLPFTSKATFDGPTSGGVLRNARSSRCIEISSSPDGTLRWRIGCSFAASRRAKGTPLVRIPINASASGCGLRSTIS